MKELKIMPNSINDMKQNLESNTEPDIESCIEPCLEIDELIPHRDNMKLITKIVEITDKSAITESLVTKNWPLSDGDTVDSIILVEVVAQTAGVCIGNEERKKNGSIKGKVGWLVGIKNASFYKSKIPMNSMLLTHAKLGFDFDNYKEYTGKVKLNSNIIGEVTLQIFWPK